MRRLAGFSGFVTTKFCGSYGQKTGPGHWPEQELIALRPLMINQTWEPPAKGGLPASLIYVLSQSYAGATMDDVDLDMLARQLGEDAAIDAKTLAELERALVNHGFLDRGSDGQWRLSPKAMRQLGETALQDVAQQLSGRRGERDHRRAGA